MFIDFFPDNSTRRIHRGSGDAPFLNQVLLKPMGGSTQLELSNTMVYLIARNSASCPTVIQRANSRSLVRSQTVLNVQFENLIMMVLSS